MSEQLMFPSCQVSTSCVEDFPARLFQLLESEKALRILEGLYSLRSPEYVKLSDLKLYSLRTSEDFSPTMAELPLRPSSESWGTWGIVSNGKCVTSRYFGVPQNRERVFIIGHYGKGSFRQVFPIRENGGKNNEPDRTQAVNSIDASYYKGVDNHGQRTMIEITKDMPDAQRVYDPDGIAKTLKGLGGGQGAKTGLYKVHSLQPRSADRPSLKYSSGGSGPLSRDDGNVYCLDTGNTQAIEIKAVPLKFLDRNQKNYQGEYSFTVDTCNTGGVMEGTRIRRLTPIEYERLQGYPDNWTQYGCNGEPISDSQRYKMCGNSVTVNVIEAIAKRLPVDL